MIDNIKNELQIDSNLDHQEQIEVNKQNEEVNKKDIEFLEIEVKFNADNIDRFIFKDLAKSLNPKEFIYVESTDTYYEKELNEFLRYRAASESSKSKRAELTFKKKHKENNNIVRTEVNLRVDPSNPETVKAFAEGLGYKENFVIWKACDIYRYDDATLVYYSVKDTNGKYNHFMEIEVIEGLPETEEEAWEIIRKYEKIIEPLGITPQGRLRKSLYEMYRKDFSK